MSFRARLYLSFLAIFLVFVVLLFPISNMVVDGITATALNQKTRELLRIIENSESLQSIVRTLESEPPLFYRISILRSDGSLVYDSHIIPYRPYQNPATYLANHPEIREALEKGEGKGEFYSATQQQELVYVAKRFEFNGETLVLRAAFPLSQVEHFIDHFKLGFFVLAAALLSVFFFVLASTTHQLSRPIGKIIRAITPYQEGRVEALPKIELGGNGRDDFSRLAETLNLLTGRIESQIDSLKREEHEKEALLESLVEGVVAVDPDMEVTYVNPMAQEMLEKEQLLGMPFSSAGQPEMHEILQRCQEQGEMLATTGVLGEKRRLHVDLIAVPKREGDGAVLVMQDKSVHYRLLEMRKDFIANASHELKTPITIIRGFAETIGQNPNMGEEMLGDVTEKIVRNCHRMETLVRNLLRLADIENLSRANLEPCELRDLVGICRDMVLTVYSDASIEVTGDQPVLLADADLLELAITNLIDNACKYSEGPAHVRVTLEKLSDEKRVKVEVADQGMGIPEEDLPQIFHRFYTVDKAHSRKLGGSGLGLSIVKTIVEKHFGTISVSSELGKGTVFTLLLPINLEEYA